MLLIDAHIGGIYVIVRVVFFLDIVGVIVHVDMIVAIIEL